MAPPAPPAPPTPLLAELLVALPAPPAPPAPVDEDVLEDAALDDEALDDEALEEPPPLDEEDEVPDDVALLEAETVDDPPPEEDEVVPVGSSFPAEHAARVRAVAAREVRRRIPRSLREPSRRSHDEPRAGRVSRRRLVGDDLPCVHRPSRRGLVDKSNFGVIPCGVPALDAAFVAAARPEVGFIYLTDDTVPNPWDTLPAYFSGLLAALE